ncbi:MAG: EAL domain-containing protein [Eubacterium sp.]|nr:EAL domain-containing protein [Eubacterium sp.]
MLYSFAADYSFAEIFCALMLILLLAVDRRIGNSSVTSRWFRVALIMTILYYWIDAIWAHAYTGLFGDIQNWTAIMNFILCIALSLDGYALFVFVITYEDYPLSRRKRNRILCVLPALICDLIMMVLYFTGDGHITNPDGSLTTSAGIIFLIAPAFYCITAAVLSFHGASKELTLERRSFFFTLGIYPTLMIICGVVETLFVSAPLFGYSMTAGMVYIYVSFTADRILTDRLTGLKHRDSMERQVRHLDHTGKLQEYTLFMVDMNGLKSTNDVYGHAVGDESLKTVADGLKNVLEAHSFDGYACRFGGDEFLLLLHASEDEALEKIQEEMREAVRIAAVRRELAVVPQIAIGCHPMTSSRRDFDRIIKSADESMYINKREMEKEIRQMDIFRDDVTGLPNANFFHNAAEKSLSSFRQEQKTPVFVFFDISNMHSFNDRYGYSEGNRLLEAAGSVISGLFPGDLVVRYTEDHFVLLTGAMDVEERCLKADEELRKRYEGRNIALHAGICFCEDESETAVSALDKARQARAYGGSRHEIRVRVYDEEVRHHYDERDYVLNHFDEAIEKGWIRPYYQAQVRTLTGNICGSEALARWVDPERGVLSPAVFVPVLEETHRIVKLDLLIVRRVCEIAKRFTEEGVDVQPVSFNLSQVDFQLCDMFEAIEKIRREYGVSPSILKIEITESALTGAKDVMGETIKRFREGGYDVWMDDFGSDYSSLRSLSAYHFDLMKIDMGFLREFDTNPHVKTVISATVRLAKQMGIHTLCEGVETKEQYDFLRDIGCERVQGYLISRPVPLDDMVRLAQKKEKYGYEPLRKNAYYDAAGIADVTGDPTLEAEEDNTGIPVSLIERTIITEEVAEGETADYQLRRLFVNEACRRLMQSLGRTRAQMETRVEKSDDSRQVRFFLRNMDLCEKTGRTVSDVAIIEGVPINVRMRMVAQEDNRSMFACTLIPEKEVAK